MNTSMFTPVCFILALVFFAVGILLGATGSDLWLPSFITAIAVAVLGFIVFMIQEWRDR